MAPLQIMRLKMGQFSEMTDKPESINLEVLRCKDCKRLVFAADDTRISHHKCSGQWTVVFAEKVVIPKITALSAELSAAKSRIGELEQERDQLKVEFVAGYGEYKKAQAICAQLQAQLQAVTQERDAARKVISNLQPRTFPMDCDLCGKTLDSTADYDWHGIGECVELYGSCCGAGMGEAMTEQEEAVMAANALLDVPYADPDDDLRMLSRQLLRRHEELAQLQAHNKALRGALREITDLELAWTPIPQSTIDKCRAALTLTQEKP